MPANDSPAGANRVGCAMGATGEWRSPARPGIAHWVTTRRPHRAEGACSHHGKPSASRQRNAKGSCRRRQRGFPAVSAPQTQWQGVRAARFDQTAWLPPWSNGHCYAHGRIVSFRLSRRLASNGLSAFGRTAELCQRLRRQSNGQSPGSRAAVSATWNGSPSARGRGQFRPPPLASLRAGEPLVCLGLVRTPMCDDWVHLEYLQSPLRVKPP